MARLSSYQPFEFLRRLGVKDQGETRLDMTETLQPTLGAGDVSVFFPPTLAPTAWWGIRHISAVATRPYIQITAAGGGGFVRYFTGSIFTGNAAVSWSVDTPAAPVLINVVALVPINLSQRGNVLATGIVGDNALDHSFPGQTPQTAMLNNTGIQIPELAFVAPGATFTLSYNLPAANVGFGLLWQDAFGPEPLA